LKNHFFEINFSLYHSVDNSKTICERIFWESLFIFVIYQNIKDLIFWYFAIFHDFWWFSCSIHDKMIIYAKFWNFSLTEVRKKKMYGMILDNHWGHWGQNHSKSCYSRREHNTVSCSMVKSWKIAKYQNIEFLIFWYITKMKRDSQKILSQRVLELSTEWY